MTILPYFEVFFPKGTDIPSIDQIRNVLGVWDLDILSNYQFGLITITKDKK